VCDPDIDIFCPSEKSSSCAQFKCLQNHLDFVTAPCLAYLKEKLRQKESCKNATATFCSQEESKWAIYRCLIDHVDQINGTCADYIREKMVEYGKEVPLNACDSDATTLCANASGFSSTLICIQQNWKNLAKDCRRLLWQLKHNSTHGSHEKGEWHGRHEHEHGHEHGHGHEYGHRHERGSNSNEEGTRGPRAGSEAGSEPKSRHEGGSRQERHDWHERHSSGKGKESPSKERKSKEAPSKERKSKPKESHSKEKKSHTPENRSKKEESKTKKSEKCLRKLKQACEKDLTLYCPNVTSELAEMKSCLLLNFAKLEKSCSQFFLYPKYKFEDKEIDTPAMDEVSILSVEP